MLDNWNPSVEQEDPKIEKIKDIDNVVLETKSDLAWLKLNIVHDTKKEHLYTQNISPVLQNIQQLCEKWGKYGSPFVCDTLLKKAFKDPELNRVYGANNVYTYLKNNALIEGKIVQTWNISKGHPTVWSILCFIKKQPGSKEKCFHVGIYAGEDTKGNYLIYDASLHKGVSKRYFSPHEASEIKYYSYIPNSEKSN